MLQNIENNFFFFLIRALLFDLLIDIDKTIYCDSRETILFTVMSLVDSETQKEQKY